MRDEFEESYVRFCNYLCELDYKQGKYSEVTYNEYRNLPRDKLAVALYVIFYDQVKLGWYKAKRAYHINHNECDALSKLLERLSKIADTKINEDTYNCRYMYTVIYNALSGVTRALRNRTLEFNNLACISYNAKTICNANNNCHVDSAEDIQELIDTSKFGGMTTFDDEYVRYKLDEIYNDADDEMKTVLDKALKTCKIPKMFISKKRIVEKLNNIVEELAI